MKVLVFFIAFATSKFSYSAEVEFLEKKVYDYCPLSQVCGLVIDHYLLDQATRVKFTSLLDEVKAERYITDQGYRLDGQFNLASNYSIRSDENVITFYDGVGVSSSNREAQLVNTYNAGITYDLELASEKKKRVDIALMERSISIKMRLFDSVNDLFPSFVRLGGSSSYRDFFGLISSVLKQSLYKKILAIYKKSYLQQINLYKNKVINLETLEQTNSLVSDFSESLFREVGVQDIMFPGEIKFKKRIINLALNIYKKLDPMIVNFLKNKDIKICSQLSDIEEKEKRDRWLINDSFDRTFSRVQFP